MNKNKGFTLIELLVVIAIIGILASVVLASLSSARDKGKNAAVKSQLANMRAQAELYYSTNDNFYEDIDTNVCVIGSENGGFAGAGGLLQAVVDSEGVVLNSTPLVTTLATAGANDQVVCHADDNATSTTGATDAWAVSAPLKDDLTPVYCVDSSGFSKGIANALGAGDTSCE